MDTGFNETAYIQNKIMETGRENLWLLPGNKQTADAQAMINSQGKPISWVRETLERFRTSQYHYLVLDTAPSLGGIQERVLWASDMVIVPTPAEALGSDGLRQVLDTMKRLSAEKGWKGGLFGVLPTFFMEQVKEHRINLDAMQKLGEVGSAAHPSCRGAGGMSRFWKNDLRTCTRLPCNRGIQPAGGHRSQGIG
ncbi:MAG: ParA family protein [Anaerolineales bacterium]|nr:ParA family protein [Anaerolineales bacterium]